VSFRARTTRWSTLASTAMSSRRGLGGGDWRAGSGTGARGAAGAGAGWFMLVGVEGSCMKDSTGVGFK
jgi:hypothetical protein